MCRFTRGGIKISDRSYDHLRIIDIQKYGIKYSLIDHTPREYSPMLSLEEINHMEYKSELATHRYVTVPILAVDDDAGSENTASHDGMVSTGAALCKLNVAQTLVLESRSADIDNLPIDCSEELVHSTNVDDTVVTTCYIDWSISDNNRIDPEEATAIKDNDFTSQERCSLQKTDLILNKEPPSRNVRAFDSDDDGTSHNESMFGVPLDNRRNFNYSNKSKIVERSELAGGHYESDRPHKSQDQQLTLAYPTVATSLVKPVTGKESEAVITKLHQPCKNATVVDDHKNETTSQVITGYIKPVYHVLVGDSVRVYPTNLFASLPQHDKFLVKERLHDPTVGFTRAKLVLKSCVMEVEEKDSSHLTSNHQPVHCDNSDDDENDDVMSAYHRQNCSSPGRILYTCDRRFNGRMKYPLPNGKAVQSKIGKGGNGFVFTMYHDRKQYAVKKTVYRANEINVHSALKHKNVLPLLAVLMGEKHERHHGKFYCFHFMPRMDYDLRQILSSKDVGCMKYFYRNCSKEPARWEKGFNNIKFVLAETLEALAYIHSNGYVHRDVKASNIMIRMRCHCRPLECTCSSKFQVKLGDFDSAGTVPGLGITEPTDQVIKFASILPLGTPGYRAPEVSMHIVLSGPYETLYTTAVDIWSFGCLCLNICIGKTAAVKQREEASLLLSRSHTCSTELWEKTTKINELKKAKPFSNEPELIRLVGSCLQVNGASRPSAKDAINVLRLLVK